MNDPFLKDHYQSPRPAFAAQLRRRLNDLQKETPMNIPHPRNSRPFALAGLALLLALVMAVFAIPGVRAQLLAVFKEVGGILFNETGRYPGAPDYETVVIPSESMTLTQARQNLPFEIALPGWLPEGYSLADEVLVYRFVENGMTSAQLHFSGPEPGRMPLELNIHHREDGQPWKQIVGTESTTSVQVNGQPAALVRGVWNRDLKQWDQPEHLALLWQHNGMTYELQSIETLVPLETLIQVAESVE